MKQRDDEDKQQRAEDSGSSRRRQPDPHAPQPLRLFNPAEKHGHYGHDGSHGVDTAVKRRDAADISRRPVGDGTGRQHVDVLADRAADDGREGDVLQQQ